MSNKQVMVVGEQTLQNSLLCEFIGRAGWNVQILPVTRALSERWPAKALILLDVSEMKTGDLVRCLESLEPCRSRPRIALMNADSGESYGYALAWRTVVGIFAKDCGHGQLLKGLDAMLQGEYWLPRKMLSALLDRTRSRLRKVGAETPPLTRKELETLAFIVRGETNAVIAKRLNVSEHTVKTHLYNVFRKINVNNRIQAANWAKSYLEGVELEAPRA